MEKIVIEKTAKSPTIVLEEGLIQFSGRSIPEDATKIFRPAMEWIKKYSQNAAQKTTIVFNFDYLDTASSKCVFDILKIVDDIYTSGNDVDVNWYYEEGDDDILDLGMHLKSFIKAPFNFIETEAVIGKFDDLIDND